MGIIYTATNTTNSKVYVGMTTNTLSKRKTQHKWHAQNTTRDSYFYRAIRKHGWDSFTWDIVAETNDIDILNTLEIFYVDYYNSMNPNFGYNIATPGPAQMLGRKHSDETKKKMSKSQQGENNPQFGKKHTKEHRKKISEAGKGNKNRLGCKHSEEAKKKISKANKGNKNALKEININRMIALYSRGLSTHKIAKIMGCGQMTVWRRLKANGVVMV